MNVRGIVAVALAGVLAVGALAGCAGPNGQDRQPASQQQPAAVAGSQIQDGSYDIEVETDSSMVNVVYCKLDVSGGEMSATMALHGEGFTKLFFGSKEEAARADESEVYGYKKDSDGWYTFTFPIEKLNEPVDVALYGVRRDTWYDHELEFLSEGIPAESVTG